MRISQWARLSLAILIPLSGVGAGAAPALSIDALARASVKISLDIDGPVELDALVVRPSGKGPYPVALITHGLPIKLRYVDDFTTQALRPQAEEFARRGYAAVVVLRRGYGGSGGELADRNPSCRAPRYVKAAKETARDLRAALGWATAQTWSSQKGHLVVGHSVGGLGSLALASDAPGGLAATINFAGGHGFNGKKVCNPNRLVNAVAEFGERSRIPTLWVYAQNDAFFEPTLARKMYTAWTSRGALAELVFTSPYSEDGHTLFERPSGAALWREPVDSFLRRHGLQTWDAPPSEPLVAALSPPAPLSAKGRKHWQRYLDSPPNKAFAVNAYGYFGWRSGRATIADAREGALGFCKQSDCIVVTENDAMVATPPI